MDLTIRKIKRHSYQAENTCKHEGGAHGFSGRKAHEQKKCRDGETPAANSRKTDGERDEESEKEMNHWARSENV